MSRIRSLLSSEVEIRWAVGEKDTITVLFTRGRVNDRVLVRVDPTLEMLMARPRHSTRAVVITQKDSSSVQRCGMSRDRIVTEDNIVPEGASCICTMKAPRSFGLMVQIVRPSDDHTSETLLALHLISLAIPPVWTSQIMMAVSETQAMDRPSGE